MENETGNVRSELPLDIEIDSNIVYMIISIHNYSSFSVLKFIFFWMPKKFWRILSQHVQGWAGLEYENFNGIISSSLIKALRVSCSTRSELFIFRTIYSLSHITPFNQNLVSHQSLQKPHIKVSIQRLHYLRSAVKFIRCQW